MKWNVYLSGRRRRASVLLCLQGNGLLHEGFDGVPVLDIHLSCGDLSLVGEAALAIKFDLNTMIGGFNYRDDAQAPSD